VTDARVPLFWVDAFCEGPFTGNPAAVCLLEGPGSDFGMQALARELGLSETAFAWPEGEAFGLRWFTPVSEIELCGHATVAAAHALAHSGRLEDGHARFSTKSGWLEATVDGEQVEIDLPAETPVPADPPPELAAHWPVVRAAAGRFDLLVELESEDAVRRLDPEAVDLAALCCRGVSATARGGGGADYVLRFFAPSVGVAEDPVTGSAQCLLGPYWAAALGRTRLCATQLSARGGVLRVRVGATRVGVGGRASTVFVGELAGSAAQQLLAAS
jgi:PhzF family phenazine biosynthesis protein